MRWVLLVLVVYLFVQTQAGFVPVKNEKVSPYHYYWSRFTMYNAKAPEKPSFVHLKYNFSLTPVTQDVSNGQLQLFLVSEYIHPDFTVSYMRERLVCPSHPTQVFPATGNIYEGSMYYRWFNYTDVDKRQQFASIDERFNITISSAWYLYLVHCKTDSTYGDVIVNGVSEWKNTFGYLAAQEHPFLMVYLLVLVLYCLSAMIWYVNMCVWNRNPLFVQKATSALFLVNIMEYVLSYVALYYFNVFGYPNLPLAYIASFTTATKRAMIRILCLLISFGYQVIIAKFSKQIVGFISIYYLLYFGISFGDQVVRTTHLEDSEFLVFMFTFPSMFLDGIFFCWVFLVLYRTIFSLKFPRRLVKLKIYKKFARLVITAFVLVILWTLLKLASDFTLYPDDWWEMWWLWDAYWDVFYLCVLVVGCIIWRPVRNNIEYWYLYNEIESALVDGDQEEEFIDRNRYIIQAPSDSSDSSSSEEQL
eukprot:TRINITY_DN9678_c0_g1_i1.p1 TRINITY_DN9678_c0_g1~~TRINITY_DN9678_c0_g1_i1.p1  ORF type:complete len:475 (-),score=38.55 TRINITY_DN9678_c0_g1_i1:106-1530(-)